MKLSSLSLVAAAGLLATAVAAQASLVSVISAPSDPEVGDSVSVTLGTSSDITDVFGFDVGLRYDADVLSFVGIDYDASFDIIPLPENTPVEAPGATGEQTLSLFTAGRFFAPLVSGEQTLATFNFTAVGEGTTLVSIIPVTGPLVSGPGAVGLFDGTVSTEVTVGTTIVDPVAPIPLPASVLFLLGATGGLFGLRRFARA